MPGSASLSRYQRDDLFSRPRGWVHLEVITIPGRIRSVSIIDSSVIHYSCSPCIHPNNGYRTDSNSQATNHLNGVGNNISDWTLRRPLWTRNSIWNWQWITTLDCLLVMIWNIWGSGVFVNLSLGSKKIISKRCIFERISCSFCSLPSHNPHSNFQCAISLFVYFCVLGVFLGRSPNN